MAALKTKVREFYSHVTYAINSRRIQRRSLLKYWKNKYSQLGDDGIIEEIFSRLGFKKGFFVEFGGWDGIHLSNARKLFEEGWDGAFIEADKEKFSLLRENYKDNPNIICINEFVTHDPHDKSGMTFDAIADKYFPNWGITLLSIDIDGMDYRVFESIKRKATLAIVEGGAVWNPRLNVVIPDELSKNNLHQPLLVIFNLGREKGYSPICFNLNTYFIDSKYFHKFSEIRNDAVTLWKDYWHHLDFYSRLSLIDRRKLPEIRKIEGWRYSHVSFEQYFLSLIKY